MQYWVLEIKKLLLNFPQNTEQLITADAENATNQSEYEAKCQSNARKHLTIYQHKIRFGVAHVWIIYLLNRFLF